jgi:hypothetical protein
MLSPEANSEVIKIKMYNNKKSQKEGICFAQCDPPLFNQTSVKKESSH